MLSILAKNVIDKMLFAFIGYIIFLNSKIYMSDTKSNVLHYKLSK